MSLRKDIRSGIIAAIEALVASTVTVAKWSGEDAAFNDDRNWPSVYVSYAGMASEPGEELGAVTYFRDMRFDVYVGCRTTSTEDGDDQAMDLLETIEEGITGTEIAAAGILEPAGEEGLVAASMGRFLYGQAWRLQNLESH